MNAYPAGLKPVTKFGGRLVGGDKRLDGEHYNFRAVFESDEDIDAFLEHLEEKTMMSSYRVESARDIIDGFLTLFYSVTKQ